MLRSTPNDPTFIFDQLPLHWQMTRSEKYAFASLVEKAAAEVAIEIGTYKGGSLQVISPHVKKVYSIDSSVECKNTLSSKFDNVEFLTGDSKQLLPSLLDEISRRDEPLGFVLIDGDHTFEGVRSDINAVLQYKPIRPMYVVFHDSFHPECREGILAAQWHDCRHVHFVEVDFISGVFHFDGFDTAPPRSMYGGLAVAILSPETRTHDLVIHQSQKGLYETVLPHSCHAASKTTLRDHIRSLKQKLRLPTMGRHVAR
ncbi:class I SAM-dependent methyltransferase [Novipirellula sp. SH528]|uniref:class I SAM-dependent methyltransferase n=1 Tax=Novipirellula sp. SH528 TaxID=3454466 RepID=UPI003F9F6814